jgi:hypothetical protein
MMIGQEKKLLICLGPLHSTWLIVWGQEKKIIATVLY